MVKQDSTYKDDKFEAFMSVTSADGSNPFRQITGRKQIEYRIKKRQHETHRHGFSYVQQLIKQGKVKGNYRKQPELTLDDDED